MTLHILSNNINDCKKLVENLTGETILQKSEELLEANIERKIDLFSFMNYNIYDKSETLIEKISRNCKTIQENPERFKYSFSEVVIVLDNEKINEQIKVMTEMIEKDDILDMQSYFSPFFIFLSKRNLDLSSFVKSKRFYYKFDIREIFNMEGIIRDSFKKKEEIIKKIKEKPKEIINIKEGDIEEIINIKEKPHNLLNLNDEEDSIDIINDKEFDILNKSDEIINTNENISELVNIINDSKDTLNEDKIINEESVNKLEEPDFLEFLKKLKSLFIYYNELGDNFSFINSEGNEVYVNIEDETDITVYLNILMLGRSGSGKSTLINLLLDEKKSFEGGIGTSTTSRDIIVYKKSGIPLRFYDAKGIEDQKTVNNYVEIIKNYCSENKGMKDNIHIIFYLIEYKKYGTLIENMEIPLFEELNKLKIPILFIITKCPKSFSIHEENDKKIKKKKKKGKTIKR